MKINSIRWSLYCMFLILTNCGNTTKKVELPDSNITRLNTNITATGFHVNKPQTVENLSLFIISGKAAIKGKNYITLTEAMKDQKVAVIETSTVNNLAINNTSDSFIFIHSGDIVKGGKQDRTISYDIIIPPHTKNGDLESFCVEQGRWKQRVNEEVAFFSSNSKMLSSRDLKLATKYEKNQNKVWRKVSEQKSRLNEALSDKNGYHVDVADTVSNTSLQLALENKALKNSKVEFLKTLKDAIKTKDAIGYAYAINGDIYGVEIYNNEVLFQELWGKIIESVIVEAISKKEKTTKEQPLVADVVSFINTVKNEDQTSIKKLNEITQFETLENKEGNIVFVTHDLYQKNWIHKSYMKKDTVALLKNKTNQKRSTLQDY